MNYVMVFAIAFGLALAALIGVWLILAVFGLTTALIIFGGATLAGLVAVIIEFLTEERQER